MPSTAGLVVVSLLNHGFNLRLSGVAASPDGRAGWAWFDNVTADAAGMICEGAVVLSLEAMLKQMKRLACQLFWSQ